MASPFPIELPKFDNTIGALLIGGIVSSALWGITSIQTYIYFLGSANDRRNLKLLIVFLWCLDTFDSCVTSHMLYHYLIQNFANPFALIVPVWSAVIHIAVAAIINFIIRIMFIIRAYHLSEESIILTGGMLAVSTVDLVCGIIITVKAMQLHTFTKLGELSNLMYLNFAAGTSADTFVAVTLCYYLFKARTGFERTDGLVRTLILYTVNTGLLVAVDATIGLVLYVCLPKNFIFMAFYFLLPKLYLNSYLAALNARERLRNRTTGSLSIHLSKLGSSHRYDTESGTRPTSIVEKKTGLSAFAASVDSAHKRDNDRDEISVC